MKTRLMTSVLATVVGMGIIASAQAQSGFHFPVGFAYTQGGHDVNSKLADAYQADWQAKYGPVTEDRINIPLGLTFSPYYSWYNGFGAGLDLGPTLFMVGTLKNGFGSVDDTKFSYIIPIGADIRYNFFASHKVSPYVRVGVKYPIAGGDDIGSSQPGPFAAVGVEFWRTRRIGMAAEVGYDASKVKIESVQGSEHVTFAGFTAGLSVLF
jgi:hypothetical protein